MKIRNELNHNLYYSVSLIKKESSKKEIFIFINLPYDFVVDIAKRFTIPEFLFSTNLSNKPLKFQLWNQYPKEKNDSYSIAGSKTLTKIKDSNEFLLSETGVDFSVIFLSDRMKDYEVSSGKISWKINELNPDTLILLEEIRNIESELKSSDKKYTEHHFYNRRGSLKLHYHSISKLQQMKRD